MALLDNVEQRVYPNYEFPIVAEAAIVAYLALSKPVPKTIISAVIAVNAKKDPAQSEIIRTAVSDYNAHLEGLDSKAKIILGDFASRIMIQSILGVADGNLEQKSIRLGSAIEAVGWEIVQPIYGSTT